MLKRIPNLRDKLYGAGQTEVPLKEPIKKVKLESNYEKTNSKPKKGRNKKVNK